MKNLILFYMLVVTGFVLSAEAKQVSQQKRIVSKNSASSLNNDSTITADGFEYETIDQLKAVWKITGSGFHGSIQTRLNTKDIKEGRQCLELIIPRTKAKGKGRLNMSIAFKNSMTDMKQFRFWIFTDKMAHVFLAGQYFIGKDGDFYRFVEIKNKGKWKKVSVTRDQLKLKKDNPSWEDVNRMNFTIWFPPNTPENRILIDGAVWDSQEEKLPLNKKWYEWEWNKK